MNLNEYQEKPDEGLFDKVARRLAMRRLVRVGGGVVAAVAVGLVAWGLLAQPGVKTSRLQDVETSKLQNVKTSSQQDVKSQELEVSTSRALEVLKSQSPEVSKPSSLKNVEPQGLEVLTWQGQETAHPELPGSTVNPTDIPLTELILDTPTNGETARQQDGETSGTVDLGPEPTAPATPHYDNLLLAPTVIVPTADEEENRVFKVMAAEPVSDFRMAIFSRAGRQIFSTNDIDRAWDATRDGQPVPQGAYVWMAQFRDSAGNPRTERGSVVVVR